MPKQSKLVNTLKLPAEIYFSFLAVGVCIGMFLVSPQEGEGISDLKEIAVSNFISIFTRNATVVIVLYISTVFTKLVAWFIFAINGIVHGVVLGWVLTYNTQLLWLMFPHGLFEIPCILLTGIVISKGERFARENTKKFILYLGVHLIGIGICAAIEAFVTPMFQR